MRQQQSDGSEVKVSDFGGLDMPADNTTSRKEAVKNILKDFDECQKMAKNIEDLVSSVGNSLRNSISAITYGVDEIRKLRDEMESLNNKDEAFQKLQKQVEMLERAIAMREEMEKTYRRLSDASGSLSVLQTLVQGTSFVSKKTLAS
ncbi:hypothetical protein FPOAC1_003303 [Fusarium poae]|uniref:Uncharacterized protein n=1 Tax=Fusarium poae TaxID=36050 RepID=A0A1B8B8Z2_FUSPO|nr:hypothetical protein FPOAC1_003303 [Fusarium poae]KAG8677288.1 hypothetical protein FPOAC1_003303 [Fusarium poae]OBS29203.1 hypothetical protein FPOA_03140 [Fusarium poae]